MKKSKTLRILSFCFAFIAVSLVILGFLLLEPSVKISGFEKLDKSKLSALKSSPIIYDKDNNAITDKLIVSNRIYVPISRLQKHTVDAFVSIEDARFFNHGGVDYYRIGGAAIKNMQANRFKEGASTITQQLVKNTHLSSKKKLKRKLNEIKIASELERNYSKNEILEMYLNAIYFGCGSVGIGAASKVFFDKSASDLTLNESALLAAVINNPSKYSPLSNPTKANLRRQLVLNRMKKHGKISKGEYAECVNQDILIKNVYFDQYANFLLNEASKVSNLSQAKLLRGDYVINSYLDFNLQEQINTLINNYQFNEDNKIRNKNSSDAWLIKDNVFIQALVMTSSGEIIANAANTTLNISEIYRQPGSVIKPAIAYAPAFEKKLVSPLTPILDTPTSFEGYNPQNFKNKNYGWISVADSLKLSQNVPAVRLMDLSGIEYSKSIASKLGYEFDKSDKNLALALGGMSKGARLSQIANSYQAFSNEGKFINGGHIQSILDFDGNVIYKRNNNYTKAVSPETAYFINSILSDCAVDGTARRIGKGYAAKTGTVGDESGNSDAFVVAYNTKYVIAVWIGAKNKAMPNTVNGATHPSVIAKNIIRLLPTVNEKFNKPSSIKSIDIDKHEYKVNHKILKADKALLPKDRLKGEFTIDTIPYSDILKNQFILQMDKLDYQNFVIVD